jgi:hypothetical protein
LDDLQLHQREGTSVASETDAVGWHGKAILNESNAPGEGDDSNQGPVGADTCLLQAQMTVPSQGHKDIARQEQENGLKCLHMFSKKRSFVGDLSLFLENRLQNYSFSVKKHYLCSRKLPRMHVGESNLCGMRNKS